MNTIKVFFADKELEVNKSEILQTVIASLTKENKTFAIAVNGKFVAKSEYATFVLKAQDRIDIIIPMQGG